MNEQLDELLVDLKEIVDQFTGPTGLIGLSYFGPNWIKADLLKAALDEIAHRYQTRSVSFPATACEKVVAALFAPLADKV